MNRQFGDFLAELFAHSESDFLRNARHNPVLKIAKNSTHNVNRNQRETDFRDFSKIWVELWHSSDNFEVFRNGLNHFAEKFWPKNRRKSRNDRRESHERDRQFVASKIFQQAFDRFAEILWFFSFCGHYFSPFARGFLVFDFFENSRICASISSFESWDETISR